MTSTIKLVRLTKQELARLRNEAWRAALRDHRVVNFADLNRLTSYRTRKAAIDAAAAANAAGINAFVVTDWKG